MSWAVGYDVNWDRDVGYGVPSVCDHPDCDEKIDRGLSYVCGDQPYGGSNGCGLYFCSKHLETIWDDEGDEIVEVDGEPLNQVCASCAERHRSGQSIQPFRPKPDTTEWINHKLTDPSWGPWRAANPCEVNDMRKVLAAR